MSQLSRVEADALSARARALASSLGHARVTVEHLIAVFYTDNKPLRTEAMHFVIERTPFGRSLSYTDGFIRVYTRITEGMGFAAAVIAEGMGFLGLAFNQQTRH